MYVYGGMSRSYEVHVLEYIENHSACTRKEIIAAFPTLTAKTVYNHINKLLTDSKVVEDKYGALRTSEQYAKDTWPVIKVLTEFTNFSEITNAFALQDERFLDWCMTVAAKHGTEIAVLLTQCTIITSVLKHTDVHKNYGETRALDRDTLTKEQEQLEKILSFLEAALNQAA